MTVSLKKTPQDIVTKKVRTPMLAPAAIFVEASSALCGKCLHIYVCIHKFKSRMKTERFVVDNAEHRKGLQGCIESVKDERVD